MIYFSTKNADSTYITTETSLYRPVSALISTKESIPSTIPSETLAVNGIITMVTKQGTISVMSSKLIWVMERIIKTPTSTNALVVAADGIIRNRGEKKRDAKKSRATVNAVRPVRPPAAMPVVLLPANGSRIQAPACVEAKMIRLSRPNGFCVGCFVQVFSQGAISKVNNIDQKRSFIV